MNPNTRNMIVFGGLVAVLAVVGIVQFTKGSSGAKPAPKSAQTKTAQAGTPAKSTPGKPTAAAATGEAVTFQEVDVDIDSLLKEIEVVNFDYQTERIDRDPMAPLVGIVRPIEGMAAAPLSVSDVMNKKVTGIIYDETSPAAVVDDEVVTEGYTYPDGTVVQDIQPDRVIFKVGDSTIPVEMKKLGAG
ncbi:MAG: hypothetical protein HYV26_11280 [Candidatus Hydrogenedentes bacterium]|nr:hypothetical protein [Candidatus Hydrogenedentota bacterium]MBI3118504.1 hypothetical protein [Candidatus Hydrogenedentota bacterium]